VLKYTRAFKYSKFEYLNFFFVEYVNGHFSVENSTCAFTYSTVEYVKTKTIIDDDDNGTVWHRLSHLEAT
jgi:hypothetical protein